MSILTIVFLEVIMKPNNGKYYKYLIEYIWSYEQMLDNSDRQYEAP